MNPIINLIFRQSNSPSHTMPYKKESIALRKSAVSKYRRKRTLVKKMLELAKSMNMMINMQFFDPKQLKLEEVYTHPELQLSTINEMMEEALENKTNSKQR